MLYDGFVLVWLMETSSKFMANNAPLGSIFEAHKKPSFATKGNTILTLQAPAKEGSLAKLTLSYNTLIPNGQALVFPLPYFSERVQNSDHIVGQILLEYAADFDYCSKCVPKEETSFQVFFSKSCQCVKFNPDCHPIRKQVFFYF